MAQTWSWVYVQPFGATAIGASVQSQLLVPPGGGAPGVVSTMVQQFVLVSATDPAGGEPVSPTIDGNGLHVVIEQGAPQSERISFPSLDPGANATTESTAITMGLTGTLQQALLCAAYAAQWDIQVVDNSLGVTTHATILTQPGQTFDFTSKMNESIKTEQQSSGDVKFQITLTNIDSQAGTTAFVTLFWAEN